MLHLPRQIELMVYFIQSGKNGPIKIGYSGEKNFKTRFINLQIGNPEELTCLGLIPGTKDLESHLHHRFVSCHVRGEWYENHEYLVGLIEKLKSTNPKSHRESWDSIDSYLGSYMAIGSRQKELDQKFCSMFT